MTYIYLFKAPGMMYAGQHRCANNKDPMKDSYMGSGRNWCDYLDKNGWHKIKEFRKHVERIILEVIYEDDREKVGEAEKRCIALVREKYPEAVCNISRGSKPCWKYETTEEAEEANKANIKAWHESPEGKAYMKAYDQSPERKAYHKARNQSPEGKAYQKVYEQTPKRKAWKKAYCQEYDKTYQKARNQTPEGKRNKKVNHYANTYGYPNPSTAVFPPKWSEEDKLEYVRQWKNHEEKK